jgi:putative cardiolipin synthase
LSQRLLRYLGIGLASCMGLVVALYLAFVALMVVTENHWLGSPPFHAAIDVASSSPHELTLIDQGATSLALRLEMIRAAKRSLDLEFFIFELDAASRIVSQALAEKARSGVRVRVLVDFSLAVFELRPVYARELMAAGVEVRYYNTASVARFFSVQHRTHRKIFLVDDEVAMIGGRNIANDYFDLSDHYNFLDSDVMITGEVVGAIGESFDLYWNSPWVVTPDSVADEESATGQASPASPASTADLLKPKAGDPEILRQLAAVNTDLQAQTCPNIRFVTDYPGAGLQNRKVFGAIMQTLARARERVVAESPYLVLRVEGLDAVSELTARGIDVTVLTNSLHSTDAYYTVSPLYFALDSVAETGLELYAYDGSPSPHTVAFPGSQRWGVHSKRAVIDDDTIMIGTYNVDPRSANLNSELLIVCEGAPALAAQMHASLVDRIGRARPVIGNSTVDSSNLIGDASSSSKMLMILVAPVASLFDFLL